MALISCPECHAEISSDAAACPHCGKPNRSAQYRAQDSRQKTGCAVMLLSLILLAVSPPIGAAVFLIGLAVMLINTRFS